MIQKKSIYEFLKNVLVIYSVAVISLMMFCVLFGKDAKEISSMFSLGSEGLAIHTLAELLLVAFVISGLQWLFFTDRVIKNLSIIFRTILMFVSIILLIALSVVTFKWFPVNEGLPWIMFLGCFFVYAAVSVGISVLKEKSENKKMQAALDRLKEEVN